MQRKCRAGPREKRQEVTRVSLWMDTNVRTTLLSDYVTFCCCCYLTFVNSNEVAKYGYGKFQLSSKYPLQSCLLSTKNTVSTKEKSYMMNKCLALYTTEDVPASWKSWLYMLLWHRIRTLEIVSIWNYMHGERQAAWHDRRPHPAFCFERQSTLPHPQPQLFWI